MRRAASDPQVGGVSVRGASHERARMPNQDAMAFDERDGWCFLAVADGHGSARHYRSDRGSAFAVAAALDLLREAVREPSGTALSRAAARLAPDLVVAWRERVEADIRAEPVREPSGFDSHAVYGATCLAAAVGPDAALFLQIGDGDIVTASATGGIERAIPLDPDLVGPGTYSLCQPDAVERINVRVFSPPHPLSRPDFVMASTDGLSKSYPDDGSFLAVARHVRATLLGEKLPAFLREFEPWLAKCSALGSRDDATVAFFLRAPG